MRARIFIGTSYIYIYYFLIVANERDISDRRTSPSGEDLSLVDLYDEILDLRDELYDADEVEDLFSMAPETRDTWDLFNALVCHTIYTCIIYNF